MWLLLLGSIDSHALLVSLLHIQSWDLVVGRLLLLGCGLSSDPIHKPLREIDFDWLLARRVALMAASRLVQFLLQLIDAFRAAVIFLAILLNEHVEFAALLDIGAIGPVLEVVTLGLALPVTRLPATPGLRLNLVHVLLMRSCPGFSLVLLIELMRTLAASHLGLQFL